MKKKIIVIWLALAAFVADAYSQRVNLSLWSPVDTQRMDTIGDTWFNLGIYSRMNQLKGVGVNVFSSVVRKDLMGTQISGLTNIVNGKMKGLQLSGIFNVNGRSMQGVSASGLMVINGNNTQGVVCSGLINASGNWMSGLSATGLVNLMGRSAQGVLLSGMANVVMGSFKGVSIGGLANVTGYHFKGLALGSLANIVGGNEWGVALSALGNVTGGTMYGAQIGILNYAGTLKGIQLGLVNCKSASSGFQLGLANLNPDTRYQFLLFGGNFAKGNIAVRFKNQLFYTILGLGTNYMDVGEKYYASAFYRAGMWTKIYKDLSLSGDIGFQHIESFRKHTQNGIPPRLYGLQARLNLEYMFTKHLGVMATGGYSWDRYYNKGKNYRTGVIGELGIILQ